MSYPYRMYRFACRKLYPKEQQGQRILEVGRERLCSESVWLNGRGLGCSGKRCTEREVRLRSW